MYTDAYIEYLIEFHVTRDWFECHEIMEEKWKEEQDTGWKPTWHMLVKLAVGQYHERRGNWVGAVKLYQGFLDRAQDIRWDDLSLNQEQVCNLVETCLARIGDPMQQGERTPFRAMNLPLQDQDLILACQKVCESKGFIWKWNDEPVSYEIMHRHMLRRRSEDGAADNGIDEINQLHDK